MSKRRLSPSEAISGFCAWLISRDERITFSKHDDVETIANAVTAFCLENGLLIPRLGFQAGIKWPAAETIEEMTSDVVELAIGEKQYLLEQLRRASGVLVRVIEHELTVMEGGEGVEKDDGLSFAVALVVHQAGLLEASGVVDADKIQQTLDALDDSPYQYLGMSDMSTGSDIKH